MSRSRCVRLNLNRRYVGGVSRARKRGGFTVKAKSTAEPGARRHKREQPEEPVGDR